MTLNIGTWNGDGQIDAPKGSDALVAWLQEDNLDAVALQHCLPHVFTPEYEGLRRRLGSLGYRLELAAYGDTDGRKDQYSLGLVGREDKLVGDVKHVRLGKDEEERMRWAGRAALHCVLRDQAQPPEGAESTEVDVFAIHLDDRSEETRLGQQQSLLVAMDASRRTVIAGDRNATYGTSIHDEAFRILGWALSWVRPAEPGTPVPSKYSLAWLRWAPHRVASVFQRLREMSSGVVMDVFTRNGFRDADPDHRPTMYRPLRSHGIALAQVDGVLVSAGLEATAERRPRVARGRHARVAAHVTAVPFWPSSH